MILILTALKLAATILYKRFFKLASFIFSDTKRILLLICVSLSLYCVFLWNSNNTLNTNLHNSIIENQNTQAKLDKTIIEYERVLRIERESYQNYKKTVEKLSRLETISNKKQSLAEKLVNNGSKERNRCFELATGAQAGVLEKNSVCPHILGKK